MTADDVRQSFLKFFEERGHRVVPSASVIPWDDPTLLFTNAGMNQFKDVFLGSGKREYTRAADTQKCIRVSGKHNDLEEVGKDTYHHTFFEMLGNWSFGDYYKKEAIQWAWELLTHTWKLPKRRLWATVFDTDDEAYTFWKSETDIDHGHILRFGEKDNFWEMGETGPCGPCSEIHLDLTNEGDATAELVNAGTPNIIEIWNLVFIQYDRDEAGTLHTLPAKHVDTGMGLERLVAVLQGKQSNYDTDLFQPIILEIEKIVGNKRGSPLRYGANERTDVAIRVIADHIRALTFAVADGAVPSNEGRGYVLRRILRRAARFGRNLELHEPFIYSLVNSVVRTMAESFPELQDKQTHIELILRAEEEGFNVTLDRGLEIFESVVSKIDPRRHKSFPGSEAFRLYDTYGFPLDLTQLMAEESGLKVDIAEFNELMEEQRERARQAARKVDVTIEDTVGLTDQVQAYVIPGKSGSIERTEFVGYEKLEEDALVVAFKPRGKMGVAILERTPFYVESGGQVDDTGVLRARRADLRVVDVDKKDDHIVHVVDNPQNVDITEGTKVRAIVDKDRRFAIMRNHTATHIVHEALRRVLGSHVHQQGSLVAPDRLRFDFPHFGKITPEELRGIEEMVNEKIREDIEVHTEILAVERARKIPNVKMFFGDKYGDIVRVVFVDEQFSVEFCGGTHVKNTKEIGLFKIISESSIASGVRRIEAVTGTGVDQYIERRLKEAGILDDHLARAVEEKESLERELAKFREVKPAGRPSLGKISLESKRPTLETVDKVDQTVHHREETLDRLNNEVQQLRKELGKFRVQEAGSQIDSLVGTASAVDGFKVVSARIDAGTMDELKSLGDRLRSKLGSGVGVLASVVGDKVALVCVVTDDLIEKRNLQAGKIVGELAKRVGGGGGGRAHLATAGGKDIEKLDAALENTVSVVRSLLKG